MHQMIETMTASCLIRNSKQCLLMRHPPGACNVDEIYNNVSKDLLAAYFDADQEEELDFYNNNVIYQPASRLNLGYSRPINTPPFDRDQLWPVLLLLLICHVIYAIQLFVTFCDAAIDAMLLHGAFDIKIK